MIHLLNFEFVKIFCYENPIKYYNKNFAKFGNASKLDLIYEEIIPLIPEIKNPNSKEDKSFITNKETNHSIPNILLIAIDSISYLNFERHFPLMKKFVKKNNFYELKGYNKVGVNTWPNMIPFLTGLKANDLVDHKNSSKIFFDDFPLIWKRFAEKGFRTLFLEEMTNYGLFNYEKKGFKNKPTDYFSRPFSLGIKPKKYYSFCYNGKLETEVKK